MNKAAPVNTAKVKDPQWKGVDSEFAIVVSRGEPRRTDLQMEQAVADQARRYLNTYTHKPPSELAIGLAVQLIAEDYITKVGAQGVMLTAEHLRKFVAVAEEQIAELAKHHSK